MRKLVTFRTINSIEHHPNADNLEIAVIDGWRCIVPINTFGVGDLVLYFEVDSLIPVSEEFEFLRKYSYVKKNWLNGLIPNGEGFRIKTLKLRGQVSQGLVLPVDAGMQELLDSGLIRVGDDLSSTFGVIKYDPPEYNYSTNSGTKNLFPNFVPKTHQTRIQNLSKFELDSLPLETFEVTRKYHGMSMTVYAKLENEMRLWDKIELFFCGVLGIKTIPVYRYGVCSHNVELDIHDDSNVFVQFAHNSGMLQALKDYVLNNSTLPELAIQAELCGPGIQANHHGLDEITAFVFDIYDIQKSRYLLPSERVAIYEEVFSNTSLVHHALVEAFYINGFDSVSEYLNMADYKLLNGNYSEGLVWKGTHTDISFKVINNNFLLHHK